MYRPGEKINLGFYGIGNLGYALLRNFDSKNPGDLNLVAYDLDQQTIDRLDRQRHHPKIHPKTKISDDVKFVHSPEELLNQCRIIILSVPSTATKDITRAIRQSPLPHHLTIINTSKSLDIATGKRLSLIFNEELDDISYTYALLAGGMIANDVFNLRPLGANLACQEENQAHEISNLFKHCSVDVHPTADLIGVEYASALKNIVSIVAGIVHGLGLPYGSETYHISKTASLIANACIDHLGAQPATFSVSSQSWGNDMFMSATGNTRNRYFGVMLGQGVPAGVALQDMADRGKLVEGVNTLRSIQHIPELAKIKPIQLLSQRIIYRADNLEDIQNYFMS